MSTWTSRVRRAALLLLVAVPVSGAAAEDAGVRIAAPRGYCISESDAAAGIVLIGTCAGMKGAARSPRSAPPAILTATVGPGGSAIVIDGNESELSAFFTSPQGHRALSRSGRASSVVVLETAVLPDARNGPAFLLRARDIAPFPGGRATDDYWRALMPVGDRMITLTVLGLQAAPLDRDTGLGLLRDFVTSMRRANRN